MKIYKTVIWKPMNKRYENKQNHSHNTILRGEKILWKKKIQYWTCTCTSKEKSNIVVHIQITRSCSYMIMSTLAIQNKK